MTIPPTSRGSVEARRTALSPAATRSYAPQDRVERLIAIGRAVLAATALLAFWLDRSAADQPGVAPLLRGYALYSVVVVLVTYRRGPVRLPVATYLSDMFVFTLLMLMTDGAMSPFFVYFVFSLIAGTLRWRLKGAIYTGVAVLVIYTLMAVTLPTGHEFHQVFIRGAYLAVAALGVGYLGAYQQRLHDDLSKLAAWPRSAPRDLETAAREVLEQALAVSRAPRAILTWEEKEEPWVLVAEGTRRSFHWSREAPGAFDPLVAAALSDASFLCENASASYPMVMINPASPVVHQLEAPVGPVFQARFNVHSVLSSPVRSEDFRGRLFLLDVSQLTVDDLLLADILGRHATAHLTQCYLLKRLGDAAAQGERVRLARDLHDGVLQSLTASALQLQTAALLIDREPAEARARLSEIANIIEAEQAELRSFIMELRPTRTAPAGDGAFLTRIRQLASRLSIQWRVPVDFVLGPLAVEPTGRLARELHRLIHEAIVNAARHAGASLVRVELHGGGDTICVSVTDNGTGFPFKGRYDLPALLESSNGPASLMERTIGLGGEFVVESTEHGARVEFVIPIAKPRKPVTV